MRSYWDYNLAIIVTFLVIWMTNDDLQELSLNRKCFEFLFDGSGNCNISYYADSLFHTESHNHFPEQIWQVCYKENYTQFFDDPQGPYGYHTVQSVCCTPGRSLEPLVVFAALILVTLIWSQIYESTLLNFFGVLVRLVLFGGYTYFMFQLTFSISNNQYCKTNNKFVSSSVIMFVFLYILFCLLELFRLIRVFVRNRKILTCKGLTWRINEALIIEEPKTTKRNREKRKQEEKQEV